MTIKFNFPLLGHIEKENNGPVVIGRPMRTIYIDGREGYISQTEAVALKKQLSGKSIILDG